ncbi:hypothetical protein Nepgr_002491 [Nepenthes gracilis]|uniref:Protein kinase domain-containing protein n=1 Tax=Nepenthes gracilis TaxID=150966 RepID=A0AAD3PA13_NEPGR|nr:hypothetical protein Nepgr_002491 [Nepenthes gracilis]
MKCFYYFKHKIRSKAPTSAPELSNPASNSDITGSNLPANSSCSTVSGRSINDLYEEKSRNLRVFSLPELRRATSDFNRLLKIGEGGFGSVYKGTIKPVDGTAEPVVVAIKKLNNDGYQGHKHWLAEVQVLSIVEHPNLVKLIGYCTLDGERGIQRLLVYEYMPNRSLDDHLFNLAYPALPWQKRLQIIYGAALGLAYLHEELEVQVIFRDFKTSNILLDEDFQPKLSDFGLSREGPTHGRTHVSTAVVGTHGYAAPDYIETGHLTARSDTWSFGVVLYEILTGRRSVERNHPRTERNLLDWVKQFPADSKRFGMIMDPRLENEYSLTAARRIAKLADSCLVKSAKDRPKMSLVAEQLKEIIQIPDNGSPNTETTDSVDNEAADFNDKKPKQNAASEQLKRRVAQLAKLSEHVDGKRKFLIMQRAKEI